MRRFTSSFYRLRRQVARRRRDFLRGISGRDLIVPALGTAWFPSRREQALSEAFIVLFVAELETYLEFVVNDVLDLYEEHFRATSLPQCGAATLFIERIVEKRKSWAKNNNANWLRLEEYFRFIGLDKSFFPDGMWDHIETIVSQRGDIVHNSSGVRQMSDPRRSIHAIESCLVQLNMFDRDFLDWTERVRAEIVRLHFIETRFIPGIGSMGVAV